ncbi:DUF3644 domain-containing protein [Leptolyngbya sp. FACHB-17]|uniref:DUF3644 domain-containing protein n=1 Tax=unclassified Leptolyngbya TaxID=2650499 RepID=UPI001680735A|nr:DUF3644 domain-containing protein [Leptolyngbya sp. FACHB-17]MBD2078454.1 DUF3644 domain-containing protein [Leptolyngbya sp. FACHB-17]
MQRKSGNPGLKGKLLDKSIEAYVLSLETINRLSIKYRIETFAYLICNAWELLLKAKILHEANNKKSSIFYSNKETQKARSISLRKCLNEVFIDTRSPVRRNIELIEELRDESTHLVISQVPKEILSLFQSCVLNYHKHLNAWFGISISDRVPIGMMTIVYDFSPDDFDLNNKALRRQIGADTAMYLMKFQAELKKEFNSLGKPSEFSIDIGYKLALVKNPSNADIVLTSGAEGLPTHLIEVAKDASKTHPHRQKDVIAQVNASLNGTTISQYDIQCIVKIFDITKRPDYYYLSSVPGSPKQYSQAFIEWIVSEYNDDNTFFEQVRQKAKRAKKGGTWYVKR